MNVDPPRFGPDAARSVLDHVWGLASVQLEPLPSERDQNWLVHAGASSFVLKFANAAEPPAETDMQVSVLRFLEASNPQWAGQRVVPSVSGAATAVLADERGRSHTARLVTWVDGRTWADVHDVPGGFRETVGAVVATVDAALSGFEHPGAKRTLAWDVLNVAWVLDRLHTISDEATRLHVQRAAERVLAQRDRLDGLPRSVVHNDANQANVLVAVSDESTPRAVGLIDFGDMVETVTVAGLAVACAYATLGVERPIDAIADVVRGYHRVRPLSEAEADVLVDLIRARLAITVTTAAMNAVERPDDAYQQVSAEPARTALRLLHAGNDRLATYIVRAACDMEPVPTASAVRVWLAEHGPGFAPLLVPDQRSASTRIGWLDFSVGSTELGSVSEFSNARTFARRIEDRIAADRLDFAVGAYGEPRPFYSTDAYMIDGNDGPEWRTVHLGQDYFAPAGTVVMSPLAGTVHSVAENTLPLDYGPTIVVHHEPSPGVSFYSLFGHLDANVLDRWVPGQAVDAGEPLALIGAAPRNGGWPPHLHYQLVVDMLDRHGDFDGACRSSQWSTYRSLCPDAALVTRVPNAAPSAADPNAVLTADAHLADRRRSVLGRSLSVHYRTPLHIVRGAGQYLYGADGRRYVDAVNNVAHVGHSHPRVVEAIARQAGVLNTNTRYLHDLITSYAERLTALLPEHLSVVHLVCSGSEANELALRMARAATGSNATIVIDGAYHGNTNALVEISPYKFNGPGGSGPPANVMSVATPDESRGAWSGHGAGHAYADAIREAVDLLAPVGRPTFVAEAWLGSAGQIPLASGFLSAAYAHVRAAGGVCIADEVQVGFGRLGDVMWGFEQHDVVPDIVTLGKPIGNGHPIGAVVTTPAIAEAFANGMEYFNTFGGNAVSCAAAHGVLDVMADEALQANASHVGSYLLGGLRTALGDVERVGDVRGSGLFCGVELVADRTSRQRSAAFASSVASRLSELGVLVGTDFNTLKIKPPLCFSIRDADRLANALWRCLR